MGDWHEIEIVHHQENPPLSFQESRTGDTMKIAFVIYDGLTLLDFAGVYDPVTRLRTMGFEPDLDYDVCAQGAVIRSQEGLQLVPDRVSPDLSTYDYVIIPGGDGVRDIMQDSSFLAWITVDTKKTVLAAVCGGSILLGAAGLLRTRRATTHTAFREILKQFAREVSGDRIVEDDQVITAGGVTAAIDLGLYLVERISGPEVRKKIQDQMDYRNYCTV
jgi:transcriptional regulator GlxA family with amidase domain